MPGPRRVIGREQLELAIWITRLQTRILVAATIWLSGLMLTVLWRLS